MADTLTLRWAEPADYDALGEVMFDAIHNGRSHYSKLQRRAWAPKPRTGDQWEKRLQSQDIILADSDRQAAGFMSLAPRGYVDFAYIRPSFQGSGLFRRLYERIEMRAREKGVARLWTYASLVAEPAFCAVGFSTTKKERVKLSGQTLERFEMEKVLALDIAQTEP